MNQQVKTGLGVIIILIMIATAGMFIWKIEKNNPEDGKPAPLPIAIPADKTTEWQTYRNDKYGFEVKYPQTYIFQEVKEGVVNIKSSTRAGLYDLNIQIDQNPSLNILSLDAIIQNKLKKFSIKEPEKITLSGEVAYEGVGTGMVNEYVIVVRDGGHLFELLFNTGNQDTLEKNKAALDENQKLILSTFKFINSDLDYDTIGWKTYQNVEHGFEIKYPKEASVNTSPKGGEMAFIGTRPDSGYGYGIFIDRLGNTDLSAEDWYGTYYLKNKQEAEKLDIPFQMSESGKNIEFNGYVAYKTSNFGYDRAIINLYIAQNNKIYKLTYDDNSANDTEWIEHEKIINQMLSTFKFIP